MRETNTRLRQENERLPDTVRRGLGHQLDQLHRPELVTRINELTAPTHDAAVTIEQLRRDIAAFSARLEQADEDVRAARASLRRMIRSNNTGDQSARP